MISPTRRFVGIFCAGFIVSLLPAVVSAKLVVAWAVFLFIFIVTAIIDLILTLKPAGIIVEPNSPKSFYLGEESNVTFRIAHTSKTALHLGLRLDTEGPLKPHERVDVVVDPGTSEVDLRIEPQRRGRITIDRVWMAWRSRLGLFERVKVSDVDVSIRVVPNIAAVQRGAISMSLRDTFMVGVHANRRMGDGSEFQSLRKYMDGMDHRTIDWKASAKHHKLLCRENRTERNHRLVLAFDTGRLMSEPIGELPKLDHAINAGLLLGYLSLRMGDRVGLFGFDETVGAFRAPQSGVAAFAHLSANSSNLEYSAKETNFTLALTELTARLRRRSIVVVFTDFVDTVSAEVMVENILRLGRRHLVIFAAIRNPDLDAMTVEEPSSVLKLSESVIAKQMVSERDKVVKSLRRAGIFCVDGTPEQLQLGVINTYLDIHRRELL